MVQFKAVFLGQESRPYKRAASCQKCMRAGGKHSDIENVGFTARHHTFFEMLGNFSFGDYFKRQAIEFAWQLLTEHYRLPKERLWVSIYEQDEEAFGLWQELAGLSPERIVRLGAKDNFWQMADTGPCGPCSEIIIDQGPEVGCGRPSCQVGCECDRFLELWNLVFMQYDRDEQGQLHPLPAPSIDTGMGLERITAVLQGKTNNFDTDLFQPIIQALEGLSGLRYGQDRATTTSMRVIADHMRAIVFLLSEGLMPSNEARGYVLRRVIRRASRHALKLQMEGPVLYRLVEAVLEVMASPYPELQREAERTRKVLRFEEERFAKTLKQGMQILGELIARLNKTGQPQIPGEEAFRLYDTYGFPLDILRDIAQEEGLGLDEEGFQQAMEAQRERARASWVAEEATAAAIYRELHSELGDTRFLGYETLQAQVLVRAILKDGHTVEELQEGQEAEVFLDQSPFYGASGGQVGDTGRMFSQEVELLVLDTKKPLGGLLEHRVKVLRGTLRVWQRLTAQVQEARRASIMRNHTATHLLHAALREVLGEHVKQAGSLVEPERLRFDFTHFSALSPGEIQKVEELVNEKVLQNLPVEVSHMGLQEAVGKGAVALFEEKYAETVRVVSIPGVSMELCGGTHVQATGQIGPFIIVSEGSVAAGIRRVEALTGHQALRELQRDREELKALREMLKGQEPLEGVKKLLKEKKELQEQVSALKVGTTARATHQRTEKELQGVKVAVLNTQGLEPRELRSLADRERSRLGPHGAVVLVSRAEGQAHLLCAVSKELSHRLNAGEFMKHFASAAGGRGGGKPTLGQGGTRELKRLDSALARVYDILKEMLDADKGARE
jgi:alanyl-tRNA synthetase